MCEANAYLLDKDGKEELFLEHVDRVIPSDEGLTLISIFSERKKIRAFIKEMALLEHRIVLEKIEDGAV